MHHREWCLSVRSHPAPHPMIYPADHPSRMTEDPLSQQYRKPVGEDGRTVLEGMNEHHRPLWDFCLSHLPKSMDGSILDVGCGGGGFLRRLSERYPYATLQGADISEESLRMTSEVDADLIEDGTLSLSLASVDDLPFGDGEFDMVTAMETYFFWPDLEKGVTEISRVLSAGGVLAIGSEMKYGSGDDSDIEDKCAEYGMSLVRDDEMLSLLGSAGFDAAAFHGEHGVLYKGVKRF